MDWLRFIPWFWAQNYPTSHEWDALLSAALDVGGVSLSNCVATVGGVRVWVGNYPYAYGAPIVSGYCDMGDMLPTVATRIRLRRAISEAIIDKLAANLGALPPDSRGGK